MCYSLNVLLLSEESPTYDTGVTQIKILRKGQVWYFFDRFPKETSALRPLWLSLPHFFSMSPNLFLGSPKFCYISRYFSESLHLSKQIMAFNHRIAYPSKYSCVVVSIYKKVMWNMKGVIWVPHACPSIYPGNNPSNSPSHLYFCVLQTTHN